MTMEFLHNVNAAVHDFQSYKKTNRNKIMTSQQNKKEKKMCQVFSYCNTMYR